MEERTLNISCKEQRIEVNVDTDRLLMMDLYDYIVEKFSEIGVELPRYPYLCHNYQGKKYDVMDDKTLLRVFEINSEEQLEFIVCEGSMPWLTWELAMEKRKKRLQENEEEPFLGELVDAQPIEIEQPEPHVEPEPQPVENHQPEPDVASNLLTNAQPRENHQPQPQLQVAFEPQRKKTARTTARRLGLRSQPSPVKQSYTRSRTRGSIVAVNFRADAEGETVPNQAHELSDDEEDYEPSVEGEFSDVDDESEPSYVDDLDVDEEFVCVADSFEPSSGHKWSDNCGDSDSESYFDKLFDNGELYTEQNFGSIRLKPWMLFMDKKHFKSVFKEYCIQEGFSVVVRKADKERYTCECAVEGCPYRLHASILADGHTWAIKSILDEHKCSRLVEFNSMADYKWAAEKLLEDIRANPDISIKSLNFLLLERYQVQLKKSTAYNMKDYALKLTNGGFDTSYSKLPSYCEVIKQTNPGSIAHCCWGEGERSAEGIERPLIFKYIFISFKAEFEGLIRGCRGLIGVDGTHLKGNYGGVLLSAVALDGNNELFPIAHAIVDAENKENWARFFYHLKQSLQESSRTDWTIISDRQKGVLPALEERWSEIRRRYCARHLCANFKKSYPGPLMHSLFWRIVNAYSEFSFNKAMERMQKEGGESAKEWFNELGDKSQWARYTFEPSLCQDENTSNFVESFNSLLGADRCKPVLTLLEGIRRVTMVRHAKRQQIAEEWDENELCPKIERLMKNINVDSRSCKVISAGKDEFEIQDGRSHLPLSLNNKTCTCGKWQISGIPCVHAMRAINHSRCPYMPYVSEWFSVKKYKEAYGLNIHPMPSDERWPSFDLPNINPPPMKRSIGRPARNRKREHGEPKKGRRSTTVQCKKCKAYGHNSKTCKGGPTARQVREQEGITVTTRKRKRNGSAPSKSSQQAVAGSSQPTQLHQCLSQNEPVFFASQPSSSVPSSSIP